MSSQFWRLNLVYDIERKFQNQLKNAMDIWFPLKQADY